MWTIIIKVGGTTLHYFCLRPTATSVMSLRVWIISKCMVILPVLNKNPFLFLTGTRHRSRPVLAWSVCVLFLLWSYRMLCLHAVCLLPDYSCHLKPEDFFTVLNRKSSWDLWHQWKLSSVFFESVSHPQRWGKKSGPRSHMITSNRKEKRYFPCIFSIKI